VSDRDSAKWLSACDSADGKSRVIVLDLGNGKTKTISVRKKPLMLAVGNRATSAPEQDTAAS
jgi:hypothetical protein